MSHFHFTKTKRVTDPLDDRVKDRIVGRDRVYVSSGSEHSAYDSNSPSSPCLSELLHCYLHHDEEGCDTHDGHGRECDSDSDSISNSDSDSDRDRTDGIIEKLKSVLKNQNVDRFRNVLLSNVLKGIEVFRSITSDKQIIHRNMMFFLQKIGYNAAICKSKWNSCGGLSEGNYEFIDVIRTDSGARYFIDLNFADEFEIARETNQYRRLCNNLPTVFVGKSDDLKQIVKLISDGARLSLKSKGLLLPPWRKNRFMQNKWFGPYRRTVNFTPTNVTSTVKSSPSAVKCSYIGFNAVNVPLVSPTTRTR